MSEELNIIQQTPYPEEILDRDWSDNGTMPENVQTLREAVVGRKIVSGERRETSSKKDYMGWSYGQPFVLTLDDGTQVELYDTNDCCAYTELSEFLLNPELVDHVILGVGTTDAYNTWHIYADLGDVAKLDVSWSSGNPFYYGYGFDIRVVPFEDQIIDVESTEAAGELAS